MRPAHKVIPGLSLSLLLSAMLFVLSCSNSESGVAPTQGEGWNRIDDVIQSGLQGDTQNRIMTDVPNIEDITPADLETSPQKDEGLEAEDATVKEEVTEPGTLGAPCSGNQDCPEGWCVRGKDGDVCTEGCVDSCPEGWTCKQYAAAGTDVIFLCLPLHVTLCRPCMDSSTCVAGGYQDKAICYEQSGAGSFCLTPCSDSVPCPANYSCNEIDAPQGLANYCIPDSGECSCDQVAIAQELKTQCPIENIWGVCGGERSCRAEGLSQCQGAAPMKESCNDLDDDCDGSTDEEFPTKGELCDGDDADKCLDGLWACNEDGLFCNDDPNSVYEKCDDDIDNNCDGETDEGCCGSEGLSCCEGDQCETPYACKGGLCECEAKVSESCYQGDIWYLDCEGNPSTQKTECESCGCTEGECSDTAGPVCNQGDSYWTDCSGTLTTLKEDCGECACVEGSCKEVEEYEAICHNGDAYWTDCKGQIGEKIQECGACGCSDGACDYLAEVGDTCVGGDLFWTDCQGNPSYQKEDCGDCGCDAGGCKLVDQTASTCSAGSIYWQNCKGEITSMKENCGSCGCAGSSCNTNNQASTICSDGHVYWQDCLGNTTSLKTHCGSCGCTSGGGGAACGYSSKTGTTCVAGDVFWEDCEGNPSSIKESCNGCGCSNGACNDNPKAGSACSNGNLYWTDCAGNPTTLKESCGSCGCAGTACGYNAMASTTCSGNNVFWQDCKGLTTSYKESCGNCGCENGSCGYKAEFSYTCSGGNVYWTDCNGSISYMKESCGACGCVGNSCANNPTNTYICVGDDLYAQDCNGTPSTKIQTCPCGCSNGACTSGACNPGDVDAGGCDEVNGKSEKCAVRYCQDTCTWSACAQAYGNECLWQAGSNWQTCYKDGKQGQSYCLHAGQHQGDTCIWSPQCANLQ